MFRRGEKSDFERMVTGMMGRANADALAACLQVQDKFARHGAYASSRLPPAMEGRVAPIHEKLLIDVMRLIVEFSESTSISVPELIQTASTPLAAFTSEVMQRITTAGGAISPSPAPSQARERFDQRTESALKDVEIGFIHGRSAPLTENATNQGKAMHLLQALYDATRHHGEPAFISTLSTALSEQEAQVAWHYLKDRGLIRAYSVPYTATINAAGIDAIEGAKRSPDKPSASFPSVTYNIVNNTMHVGAMHNSPVQQGGMQSTQHQMVTYSSSDLDDLNRLVTELMAHLDDLHLEVAQRRKADAQIATLKAQLSDDPDPVILNKPDEHCVISRKERSAVFLSRLRSRPCGLGFRKRYTASLARLVECFDKD